MIIGRDRLVPQTEQEAFDLLKTSLRGAIDDCKEIGSQVWSGEQYLRLTKRLKAVENCCRAIGTMRQDARWFPLTIMLAQVQERARRWLTPATVETKKHFPTLAAKLEQLLDTVGKLEKGRPPKLGLILPKPQAHVRAAGDRPMQVILPNGGFHV
jgi:hypothetical protein